MQTFSTLKRLVTILFAGLLVMTGCRTTTLTNSTPGPQVPTANEIVPHNATDDPPITAEVIMGWEFSKANNSLGWVPTHDLQLFIVDQSGISTRSTGGDPYMYGPTIAIDAVNAPYVAIRMRSNKGGSAQVFWEVEGAAFNEPDSVHFAVTTDGLWHTYLVALKDSEGWRGKITRLRLDPSNNVDSDLGIAYIHLLGDMPAALRGVQLSTSHAIVPANIPFRVSAVVENTGDVPLDSTQLVLTFDKALQMTDGTPQVAVNTLAPGQSLTLTWSLQGTAGVYPLYLKFNDQILQQGIVVVENTETTHPLVLENSNVRLTFIEQPFGYGLGTLEWFDGTNWRIAGRLRALGQIRFLDTALNEHRILLYASKGQLTQDELTFESLYTDAEGAEWHQTTTFRLAPASTMFETEYQLTTNRQARLLAWSGPEYLAGEGSFGASRDSGLFPGLEYLIGSENSSGTDFADASVASRYVPHPNKITIPLMAVTFEGMTTGLMWDPLAKWDGQHDRPAALYASPNTWDGQVNHLMRLFVPGATAGLAENKDEVNDFYPLPANTALSLKAALFAAPADDPLAAIILWLNKYQLPSLPTLPRSWAATEQLVIDSYTMTTWDASKKGWHYALNDPWGPGPSAANALHLILAALGNKESPSEAKQWLQVALASVKTLGVNGGPTPWYYQTTLAMVMADRPEDLRAEYYTALSLLSGQQADGSWPYTPQARTGRAFGVLGDTSSGWTATKALPILHAARISGDSSLSAAGIKALEYLQRLPLRPEGAQTWELSLHVPDLLGSAWVSQAFVEGYYLTGEKRYLDQAQRWALAGLPFIYLWNAPDRDIMRYATIPVFGASNYNSPWFGRPVMWNGLDYAVGLHNLAQALNEAQLTPILDWQRVAEGITIATLQMQSSDGPFKGMYPDAWDVVTGEEAYSWWLIPSYLMQNILLVQNRPETEVNTRIVQLNGMRIHINTVLPIIDVTVLSQTITIDLATLPGEATAVIISPVSLLPELVSINGNQVAYETGWLDPNGAWQWGGGFLSIRIPMLNLEKVQVQVVFRK
jgi:hypothetical protein